jgi:hypothetical protein
LCLITDNKKITTDPTERAEIQKDMGVASTTKSVQQKVENDKDKEKGK